MSIAVYVNKSAGKIAKPLAKGAARNSAKAAARVAGALEKDAANFSSLASNSVKIAAKKYHYEPSRITKLVSYYSTELPSTKTYFAARKMLMPVFTRFSTTPGIDATAAAALIATPVYWAGSAVTAAVAGIVEAGRGVGRLARYLIR